MKNIIEEWGLFELKNVSNDPTIAEIQATLPQEFTRLRNYYGVETDE